LTLKNVSNTENVTLQKSEESNVILKQPKEKELLGCDEKEQKCQHLCLSIDLVRIARKAQKI
jgi:hypothetical protein